MRGNYLFIAIYSTQEGNYKHWALYFQTESDDYIFEVIGQQPDAGYERNVTRQPPEANPMFKKKYLVAEIDRGDVKDVIDYLENRSEIHSEITDWCCQDFCLESLETLREDELISQDDENYEDGIQKANKYYGPD
ncbi:hypothetical protein TWF694_001743 [Orbilia ellipsospora]|uniref:Uncharacterized protein n=1 Tax=Orbilia ellipsospora TaxID=2528407 RepID=A0AAV9X3I0_9PEZI